MRKLPGSGAQVADVAVAHAVRGDLFPELKFRSIVSNRASSQRPDRKEQPFRLMSVGSTSRFSCKIPVLPRLRVNPYERPR